MLPVDEYVFQIDHNFLKNNEVDHLRTLILSQEEFFYNFVKEHGYKNAGQAFYKLKDSQDSIIIDLINRCNVKTFVGITIQLPKNLGDKHIDADLSNRRTVLSIPLLPIIDYPPTNFWDNPYSDTPIAQALFINNNPCLFNVKKIHNVVNTYNGLRANLQFCFAEDFAVIREMIINNTLFKQP
jgi:hypothetical protein